jgi:AbrB family looped-hinge helix DNA binding protein
MPLAKVKQKGQVTIPAEIRAETGLNEGDYVEITRRGQVIVLTPKQIIDRHPAINAALADALADERSGRISPKFRNAAEFRAWLKTPQGRKFSAQR